MPFWSRLFFFYRHTLFIVYNKKKYIFFFSIKLCFPFCFDDIFTLFVIVIHFIRSFFFIQRKYHNTICVQNIHNLSFIYIKPFRYIECIIALLRSMDLFSANRVIFYMHRLIWHELNTQCNNWKIETIHQPKKKEKKNWIYGKISGLISTISRLVNEIFMK